MERFDVSEGDRFAEMVNAARAGVDVQITENGAVVAHLVKPAPSSFRQVLEAHWRSLPHETRAIDRSSEVSRSRDDDWR